MMTDFVAVISVSTSLALGYPSCWRNVKYRVEREGD